MSNDLQSATAAGYRAAISELRSATKRLTKFADGLILANDRLADECCALWSTLRLKQIAVRRLHPAAPEVWFVRTPRTIVTHERIGDDARTIAPGFDPAPFDAAVDALAIELDRIDAGIAPVPAAAASATNADTESLSGESMALAFLVKNPSWTDTQIAKACGVNRRTLYKWERYREARQALKSGKYEHPRGTRGSDGIEAHEA